MGNAPPLRLALRLCSMWLLLATVATSQTGTLDQTSPFASDVSTGNGGHYNWDAPSLAWQAETVAGLAGQLEGFELEMNGDIGDSIDVAVLLGAGWQTSAPVWSGTYVKTTDDTEIGWMDVTSASILLEVGDAYVIQITGTGTGTWGTGTYDFRGNPFYGPPVYLNGALYGDEFRIGFRTWVLADPGLQLLHVGGSCGAMMHFQITGATTGGNVGVVRAFGLGSFTIPNGPCAGTTLGLNATASLVALQPADANGELLASAFVPPAACGLVYLQAIDVSSCALSPTHLIQ